MKCPNGKTKRRTPKGRGKSGDYARSLKGHSWKKLYKQVRGKTTKIGRKCTACSKEIIVPEWKDINGN